VAKALRCPNCRAKYPLNGLGADATFPCDRCGQILKVPAALAPVENNGEGDGATAVKTAAPAAAAERARPRRVRRRERRAERVSEPGHLPWPLRILAWIVALPLGAIVVVWPARRFGLLTGGDLADVIIETGVGRFGRLAIVVVLWALAAAIFVQIFLVGGSALVTRWRAQRQRSARARQPEAEPRRGRKRPARAPREEAPAPEPVVASAGRATARSSQRLRTSAGRRTGS
jgi:hypothetical protein